MLFNYQFFSSHNPLAGQTVTVRIDLLAHLLVGCRIRQEFRDPVHNLIVIRPDKLHRPGIQSLGTLGRVSQCQNRT